MKIKSILLILSIATATFVAYGKRLEITNKSGYPAAIKVFFPGDRNDDVAYKHKIEDGQTFGWDEDSHGSLFLGFIPYSKTHAVSGLGEFDVKSPPAEWNKHLLYKDKEGNIVDQPKDATGKNNTMITEIYTPEFRRHATIRADLKYDGKEFKVVGRSMEVKWEQGGCEEGWDRCKNECGKWSLGADHNDCNTWYDWGSVEHKTNIYCVCEKKE